VMRIGTSFKKSATVQRELRTFAAGNPHTAAGECSIPRLAHKCRSEPSTVC